MTANGISLESLVTPWPIAECLSSHLAVNDLFSLSRTSTYLRAALHGYGLPTLLAEPSRGPEVRESINVGLHGTPYWQGLKASAKEACCSKTHTKGEKLHNCRLCSNLICEACIVRDSFARGKQDTFRNRCRYFCQVCWDTDNYSKSRLHPLLALSSGHQAFIQVAPDQDSSHMFCNCTLKKDGWLCLECKDKQNYEALSLDRLVCHGEGCTRSVGQDFESRRVCIWCNLTLPRHVGPAARGAWNQKIINARARNALSRRADMVEYNRKRHKMMRMSRREMRGDNAVADDPSADLPQFVRHLDSCCNYRSYMREKYAPDGNDVYSSKRGYWRYSKSFLVEIGKRYTRGRHHHKNYQEVTKLTSESASVFARTIKQRRREQEYCWNGLDDGHGSIIALRRERFSPPMSKRRIAEWVALKTRILDLAFVDCLQFFQLQVTLQVEYDFDLPWSEFGAMLNICSLTPLWEDTETDPTDLLTNADLRELQEEYGGILVLDEDQHLIEQGELEMDTEAARIIEQLVLMGKTLPLRSAFYTSARGNSPPPFEYGPLTQATDTADSIRASKHPLLGRGPTPKSADNKATEESWLDVNDHIHSQDNGNETTSESSPNSNSDDEDDDDGCSLAVQQSVPDTPYIFPTWSSRARQAGK